MGLFFNIFLSGLSFTLLAISAGFLTDGTRRITGITEYDTNKDLQNAHKWGTWGSIIAWIAVTLMVIGFVLYIIFAIETIELTGSWLVYGNLFVSLGLVAVVGVFAAISANDINKSGVSDNKGSYRQMIIAAVLAIVGFVVILGSFLFIVFYKPKKKDKSETSGIESLIGGSYPSFFSSSLATDRELASAI